MKMGEKSPGDERFMKRLDSNRANTSYAQEEHNRNVVMPHYTSRFTTIHASSLGTANHFLTGTDIAKPASFFSIIPKGEMQPWGL